jgi:hypothetical protein
MVNLIGMLPGDHFNDKTDVVTAYSHSQCQGKNTSMN